MCIGISFFNFQGFSDCGKDPAEMPKDFKFKELSLKTKGFWPDATEKLSNSTLGL